MIDLHAYLARIGLGAIPRADEEGLSTLIEAHILNVPFENLDIPLGLGIRLETDHLFDKIVTRRRGGYCFELNGLFGQLLDALDFVRYPVLARVWYRAPAEVPALTHTLNVVKIGAQPYLADVGFGGTTARLPVPLREGAVVEDTDGTVSLRMDDEFGFILTRETPDGPQDQFSTTLVTAHPNDLSVSNHFVSTHPSSHFTRSAVAGRFTNDGRVGLTDAMLTTRRGWDVENRQITTAEEYDAILQSQFGIALGPDAKRIFDGFTPIPPTTI